MDQITLAVYDDGLLITINGQSYKKKMSPLQMLWLSQDLVKEVTTHKDCLSTEDMSCESKDHNTASKGLSSAIGAEETMQHLQGLGLSTATAKPCATQEAKMTASTETGNLQSPLRLQNIMDLMKREMGITRHDLTNKRRSPPMVNNRTIFSRLAYEFTGASYPTIGRFLDRDHTTVMHSATRQLYGENLNRYHMLRHKLLNLNKVVAKY